MTIKLNDFFITPKQSLTNSTVTEKHHQICEQIKSIETNISQIVDNMSVESVVNIYIELLKNGWEIEKNNNHNVNDHFSEKRICKLEDHLAEYIMTVEHNDLAGDGLNRRLDIAILDGIRKLRNASVTDDLRQSPSAYTYIHVRQTIFQFSLVSKVDNFFNSSIQSTEGRIFSAAAYPFKAFIGGDLEICWFFFAMVKQMWDSLCGNYKMPSRQTDFDLFVLFFQVVRQFYDNVRNLF